MLKIACILLESIHIKELCCLVGITIQHLEAANGNLSNTYLEIHYNNDKNYLASYLKIYSTAHNFAYIFCARKTSSRKNDSNFAKFIICIISRI